MLKNTTLFFSLSCLLISTVYAQSFQSIYPNTLSHFSSTRPFQNGRTEINTINIDSIVIVGIDTQLFNKTSVDVSSGSQIYFADKWSFAGKNIIMSSGGMEYYTNTDNDTILLLTQAALNDTWSFYSYANGDYLQAEVTNIGTLAFLGLTDDVKTIELNAKNSSGMPIANALNGKQLLLSRNYGWVQLLSFRNFPSDTLTYYLAGLSNPLAGIKNLTADSIFNFNVGDEFHRTGSRSSGLPTYTLQFSIEKILNKSFSANADTVFYVTEICARSEYHDFANTIITTSHDTIIYPYDISQSSPLNFQGEELILLDTTNFSFDNGYLNYYVDTSYLGRLKKTTHLYFFFYDSCQCISPVIGTGVSPDITYASGLGLIHYVDGSCFGLGCVTNLVYYKKGTDEWGTPLDCASLLPINNSNNINAQINLHPNPNDGHFTITYALPQNKSSMMEIYDVMGNSVFRQTLPHWSTMQRINLKTLTAGIYVVKVYADGSFAGAVRVVKE